MAHHKSAKKRIRSNERKRIRNQAALSKVRTMVKKVYGAGTKADAEILLKEAVSYIDKTAGKGRIHKNTAARKKSALTKYVNKLEA